jgi:serine-type D-Ala-D-Ala carboxypeptidase
MEKRPVNLLHKEMDKIINEAMKNNVFSACSIGFFVRKKNGTEGDIYNYGVVVKDQMKLSTDENTVFDLASLTKPLVTSFCLLTLLAEGKLKIEDKLHSFFKLGALDHKDITLLHLLTHSSGLPAHRPYYQKLVNFPQSDRKKKIIDWILTEKLEFKPGTENLYSDLGFILLGIIIEKVSGQSLDNYWQKTIQKPLKLEKGLFFANKRDMREVACAPTGKCGWSKKRLCGVVHDDNCRSLGGVAGHAGLFGTSHAVLRLCENILLLFKGDRQAFPYSSENIQKVLNTKQGPWVFGFDTPTSGLSSSGKYFSDMTVGHLGFTGTSFWIDLQKEIAVVFLTNRVLCGDSLVSIKRLRPIVHDTIMEFLIKNPT